jgi:polysaccharide pyruvyl transferase WcaK-like protein
MTGLRKKILYIGWIGFGNLGDELMWDVFKQECDKRLDPEEYEIVPSKGGVDFKNPEPYDWVVLGGGSLILPGYIDILYRALQMGKKVMIWGSGIDWLDRRPSLTVNNLTESEATYRRKLAEVVKGAAYTGVRGPLTRKVLHDMGVNMARVEQCGDPGFLLARREQMIPQDANMWDASVDVVAVNWGTSYNRIYGGDESRVEEELVKALKQLILDGYRIYVYHVWGADKKPCDRLAAKLNDPLYVRTAPRVYNQYELISLLSVCRFSINFKLHPNLLSSIADVPFVALGYRFKVFDLVSSLDLSSCVVSTDEPRLGDIILKKMQHIERYHSEFLKKMTLHRDNYRLLVRNTFDSFLS